MIKQPMLAADCKGDTTKLKFPLLASPKIDGIRCVMVDGEPMSRSMKRIPNAYIRARLKGLFSVNSGFWDGELVVGSPCTPNCMQATTSGVMSEDGAPNFTYFVFDNANPSLSFMNFTLRAKQSCEMAADLLSGFVEPVWQQPIHNEVELLAYEAKCLEQGYEGLILRDPFGNYKYGRSTLREGGMIKLKRFTDGEAVVIGVEELMRNQNEKLRDEIGHAKRSSAKAGLVPGGTLGALRVRDVKSGVEFSIGSGFDAAQREEYWRMRTLINPMGWSVVGKIVKYKSFKIGEKDAPRFPIFQGFRDPRDMS